MSGGNHTRLLAAQLDIGDDGFFDYPSYNRTTVRDLHDVVREPIVISFLASAVMFFLMLLSFAIVLCNADMKC